VRLQGAAVIEQLPACDGSPASKNQQTSQY
jgi:hypothetical protein